MSDYSQKSTTWVGYATTESGIKWFETIALFVMIVVEVSEAAISPQRDDIDLFVLRVSNYCKSDTAYSTNWVSRHLDWLTAYNIYNILIRK